MTRRLLGRVVFAAVGIGALVMVAFPSGASAHAVLDSSSPSASQSLADSPEEIRLDFSEAVESTFSRIQLFDSDEKEIDTGPVVRSTTDDSVISATVPGLGNGVYVVVWRVVSVDGHPVSGAFPFSVGTDSPADSPGLVERILAGGRADPQMRWALALARLMGFIGAIMLVGHLWLTWREVPRWTSTSVTLMKRATTLLASGTAGVLLLQGPFAAGRSWSAITDVDLIGEVMTTRLGVSALVRLAIVVAWGALVLSTARARTVMWRATAALSVTLTLATFAVSGHPSAGRAAVFHVLVDLVHLLAVSVWVGGVIAFAVIARKGDVRTLAPRLSAQATWAMPVTIVTGLVQAVNLTGGPSGLMATGYGRLLVAKVAVVSVAVGFGARGRRALATSGSVGVRRIVVWESVLVVVVLALTSVLVGLSPNKSSGGSSGSFSVTLVQGGVLADLSFKPTKVGTAEVHAVLSPPGGSLEPVMSMSVSMSLPGRDVPAIPVTMSKLGANHFAGVVQIPYAGKWTMEARVVPSPNTTLLYVTTVEIDD